MWKTARSIWTQARGAPKGTQHHLHRASLFVHGRRVPDERIGSVLIRQQLLNLGSGREREHELFRIRSRAVPAGDKFYPKHDAVPGDRCPAWGQRWELLTGRSDVAEFNFKSLEHHDLRRRHVFQLHSTRINGRRLSTSIYIYRPLSVSAAKKLQ